MPTFQSVSEAAGAPPISPFEPPATKSPDEERELQEFVANFRYNPPAEAVDELTMRSEVPVLDAEAPVTPSHPSFDDDVPPPPEAGPHPTGEEYYPATSSTADRSRFLDVTATPDVEPARPATVSSSPSFLGLDTPGSGLPLDEIPPPGRSHWFLWSSLSILLVVFGILGYLQGRAQTDPALPNPMAIAREQYARLRQRVTELAAPAPTSPADSQPVTPAPAEPQHASTPPTDQTASATQPQPEKSANSNPSASQPPQSAATTDQQQPQPVATTAQQQQPQPASTPPSAQSADSKLATTPPASQPAVTPQKPVVDTTPTASAVDTTVAKREPVKEPPPAVAKPKSRPEPGQQELANAMQASDPAAQAAWLWKATSRGNPEAPVRLADMYIKGKGVARSCEQALVLLRAQAAKEDAPARNRLAALYANGTCVARDRVRAYQLMSSALAVDPTSEWAETNRKELWQQMSPEERTQAEKYH